MQENGRDGVEFSDEQLRAALKRVGKDARQAAFAAGRPVVVVKNSLLVALFPDGTEQILESLAPENDTLSPGQ
jgi:hypothetical protein